MNKHLVALTLSLAVLTGCVKKEEPVAPPAPAVAEQQEDPSNNQPAQATAKEPTHYLFEVFSDDGKLVKTYHVVGELSHDSEFGGVYKFEDSLTDKSVWVSDKFKIVATEEDCPCQ